MRRTLVLVLLLSLGLAGCARTDKPAAPGDDPDTFFAERAATVATAWRTAVGTAARDGFVPLDALTVFAGSAALSEDRKIAFSNGWYRRTGSLPAGPGDKGQLRYPDGSTVEVPLISADEAYAALDQGDPPCPDGGTPRPDQTGPGGSVGHTASGQCTALTVTGATFGTTTLRTLRGAATVPAWLFTVDGQADPIARVAVAPAAISALPSPPAVPDSTNPEVASAQQLTAVDGTKIGYTIGVGACDTGIRPLVYQADDVVVIGGAVKRTDGICTDQLKLAPVEVTLDKPIGARPILDVATGRPLVRQP
jgi:hypothetical protein